MRTKSLFIILVSLGFSVFTNIVAGTIAPSILYTSVSKSPINGVFANVAPTISFNSTASKYVDLASGKISCVMNNATDPIIVSGIDITVGDEDLTTVVFSMTSSKTSVVATTGFTVTGTGTSRNIKTIPKAVGYTTITLKITDAAGLSSTVSLSLAVSAALDTASTKDIYHTGVADGSTSIPIDDN